MAWKAPLSSTASGWDAKNANPQFSWVRTLMSATSKNTWPGAFPLLRRRQRSKRGRWTSSRCCLLKRRSPGRKSARPRLRTKARLNDPQRVSQNWQFRKWISILLLLCYMSFYHLKCFQETMFSINWLTSSFGQHCTWLRTKKVARPVNGLHYHRSCRPWCFSLGSRA